MPSCQPIPTQLPAGLPGMRSIGLPPHCCLAGPLPAAPAFLFSSPRRESRSNVSAGSVMLCRIVKKDLTPVNFNVSNFNVSKALASAAWVLCTAKPPAQGSSGVGCCTMGAAVEQPKQAYHRTWFILFNVVGFNKVFDGKWIVPFKNFPLFFWKKTNAYLLY